MKQEWEPSQLKGLTFEEETREKLVSEGISIFRLRGLTLPQISSQINKFANCLERNSRVFPDIKTTPSKEMEVGIDLQKPYIEFVWLPDSSTTSYRALVDFYKKFSEDTEKKFIDARAMVGEAVDFADINDQVGRDLFEGLNFSYLYLDWMNIGKGFGKGAFMELSAWGTTAEDFEIDWNYFRGTGIVINPDKKFARVGTFINWDSSRRPIIKPCREFIAPLIVPALP